ncbi:Fe-S cluster assembly protein SufD [Crocinitomix algicola]|uniref:Fe-S cluster assembly protein SufD n=1 Tax=Crocinitomix algicola TaxID=1740263 RepID=UPI0008724475|nr:Fe-S cluster assembly protein SufD [Crocinitomix algicola]
MTTVISEKTDHFLSQLSIPENSFQLAAAERALQLDFPTTRDEYWKYTRLSKISKGAFTDSFEQKEKLDIEDQLVSNEFIVIENGIVREDISQYQKDYKIEISDASSPKTLKVNSSDIFSTINRAAAIHNVKITIGANKVIDTPLQIVYLNHSDRIISNTQLEINAEKSSKSTIVITNIGNEGKESFNNHVMTVDVAENAHLTINKIQAGNPSNYNISTEEIEQDQNSTFKINTVTLKGALVRNNINIAVNGQNCETHMNGAIVTKEKQHIDNHTFVDHKVSNCFSNENYKYVLEGKATGVFNGRVVVRQDAQVINAYQNNGNILLSDHASINSKPELEIYADDVKCSHGSTTGQLDENAIFYLQARGIAKENAKKLLVAAFIGEVIEEIEHEGTISLIHRLFKEVHNWDF